VIIEVSLESRLIAGDFKATMQHRYAISPSRTMMCDITANVNALENRRDFKHALPRNRLGKQHGSLEEFLRATKGPGENKVGTKVVRYTLIVVTSAPRRILLGKKHRGFGHGMYNSFGGKIESGESNDAGAARELFEETGIQQLPHPPSCDAASAAATSPFTMKNCRAGTLRFTFADSAREMMVYLYRVRLSFRDEGGERETRTHGATTLTVSSKTTIRGCDEISPIWFDDWSDAPLDNMFADDSIWLPILLSGSYSCMDGRFHFAAGGQETNNLTDFYLNLKPNTLEHRLFNALHERSMNSRGIKEFKEAYAFFNVIRQVYKKHKFDVVIDVAGGHGALGALFVISGATKEAVVVDPARVGSVRLVWGKYIQGDSKFRFRYECLRTGLPAELRNALRKTSADRVLVLACHACQHFVTCQQMPRSTWQSCPAAKRIFQKVPTGRPPPNA
jgi:8-oxo-dGTP pyrophosphatase MutT (NUDIX family)